jgi:hypothetical protein
LSILSLSVVGNTSVAEFGQFRDSFLIVALKGGHVMAKDNFQDFFDVDDLDFRDKFTDDDEIDSLEELERLWEMDFLIDDWEPVEIHATADTGGATE